MATFDPPYIRCLPCNVLNDARTRPMKCTNCGQRLPDPSVPIRPSVPPPPPAPSARLPDDASPEQCRAKCAAEGHLIIGWAEYDADGQGGTLYERCARCNVNIPPRRLQPWETR